MPAANILPSVPFAIARQAIVGADRTIFGYELFDRSVQSDRHTAATDAQMLFNMVSSADPESLGGKKAIFINCTHDSLAGGHLDLIDPARIILEIPPLPISQLDQIQNRLAPLEGLTRRGFRLAFDY